MESQITYKQQTNGCRIRTGLDRAGLSVIIPCFNSKATIAETLKSVLGQGVDNIEVIVVDDGSTDGTRDEVGLFGTAVRYVYQQNQGVSAARNHGVRLAGKEWIAFCDSDDVWESGKLLTCADVIDNFNGVDFVFHDYSVTYKGEILAERGTHSKLSFFPWMKEYKVTIPMILPQHKKVDLRESRLNIQSVDTYLGNGLEWMIVGNFILPSSVLMKKELFLREGGFDPAYRVAEDTELFLRLSKNKDFLYIDHPLHRYCRRSDSLMATNVKETLISGINGIVKNFLSDTVLYTRHRKKINMSLGRRSADLAYYYLTELYKDQAVARAVQAFKYNPFQLKVWKVFALLMIPKMFLQKARDIKSKYKG